MGAASVGLQVSACIGSSKLARPGSCAGRAGRRCQGVIRAQAVMAQVKALS